MKYLCKLDVHKSMGPDGMNPQGLGELTGLGQMTQLESILAEKDLGDTKLNMSQLSALPAKATLREVLPACQGK